MVSCSCNVTVRMTYVQACDDWMARMLGLQLQAASSSCHHQATLYYGLKRLQALAVQASALNARESVHGSAKNDGDLVVAAAQAKQQQQQQVQSCFCTACAILCCFHHFMI